MKLVTNKVIRLAFILLLSVFVSTIVMAQTPADDPGIGGPGTSGSSPATDGSPIVPFDTNLSLVLLAGGIYYVTRKINLLSIIQ